MRDNKVNKQFEFEQRYHDLIANETDPNKRQILYKKAYTELYSIFFSDKTENDQFGAADHYLKILTPLLKNKSFVDIGCGTGSSLAFTSKNESNTLSIGLEVDPQLVTRINNTNRDNLKAMCFDGSNLPFKCNSIDIVYSNNVLEHLHPDDAQTQIKETQRILKPGGFLLCITPSAWNGPHDISKYKLPKGHKAQGLHIHEYNTQEIFQLMFQQGFRKVTQSWVSPDRLCKWKLHWLFPYLQRGRITHNIFDTQFVRNHGILHGTFCFDKNVITATK